MARILIVENDATLANILASHFTSKAHQCHIAGSLEKTYQLLEKAVVDLIILDRAVDDGDTLEVAEYLQQLQVPTRILFLSQQGSTSDRICGLESGGDDYLPKPFSLTELSLKADKLLASNKVFSDHLQLGNITLELQSGTLMIGSQSNQLRRKEAAILGCLLRHQCQVVSRDQVISEVWGTVETIPSYPTLDAYIRKIRMKLKTSSAVIKTFRGIGYLLVSP